MQDLKDKMGEEDKEDLSVESFPETLQIDIIPGPIHIQSARIVEDVVTSHVVKIYWINQI